MMKEIPLTQDRVAIIDDIDEERVCDGSWHILTTNGLEYAVGRVANNEGERIRTYMHRLILDAPRGVSVDHINGNGLDNRRCNLRFATVNQNQFNRRPNSGCSSQYKGVYWDKSKNRWRAYIKKNHKRFYLGVYTDELQAARAYDEAARELFGKYARPNFT